ncbi:hypothetical protein BH11PSE3_BH11PSE3_19430 [soil metagenome]
MIRTARSLLLGLAIFTAGTGAALAQAAFDMKGSWTGTSSSIVSGLPPYHPTTLQAKPAGPNRLTAVKFTLKIDGQQDGRIWGTLASATKVSPVIGVISPDGKSLRIVLQGAGLIEGTVVNPDTIELLYTEQANGVAVAATNSLTRQK